ncbi:MAG TPA: hypothetical protein VFN75_02600 [Pseudonocardiaceae bacterium]|nr:hypothetical protein [Pseudonocardiaceae bacterium]
MQSNSLLPRRFRSSGAPRTPCGADRLAHEPCGHQSDACPRRAGPEFRQFQYPTSPEAVYPDEAIQAHLAFLARRRALRPSEEYRVPTDEEWAEFLGHFERRKVSTGTCGRAFGTPCIHEHACIRCSMLWPDPAQRERLVEIRDNLTARITEAQREGWLGEVEGLQISLAGANHKLAQIERRSPRRATVNLGIPTLTPRP